MKMLRNLIVVFEATAEDDPLTVELSRDGVWAITPDGQRIFVGPRPSADA
ncbi:hypothetical protein [Paracoccus beibuensis]|nr:hypothetical protein [Paracoccus beibuensis]